jgi:hypothetical protein
MRRARCSQSVTTENFAVKPAGNALMCGRRPGAVAMKLGAATTSRAPARRCPGINSSAAATRAFGATVLGRADRAGRHRLGRLPAPARGATIVASIDSNASHRVTVGVYAHGVAAGERNAEHQSRGAQVNVSCRSTRRVAGAPRGASRSATARTRGDHRAARRGLGLDVERHAAGNARRGSPTTSLEPHRTLHARRRHRVPGSADGVRRRPAATTRGRVNHRETMALPALRHVVKLPWNPSRASRVIPLRATSRRLGIAAAERPLSTTNGGAGRDCWPRKRVAPRGASRRLTKRRAPTTFGTAA